MLAPQHPNSSDRRRPRVADEAMAAGVEQQLRTKVRRLHSQLKSEGGLGCVIIDYLQLMEAGKRLDSRQVEEIGRAHV